MEGASAEVHTTWKSKHWLGDLYLLCIASLALEKKKIITVIG